MSPFLHCLLVDELLDLLADSGLGATICDVYCGAPMYADDIALVASSPSIIQGMLDIVCNYASRWYYLPNSLKSLVMVIGESTAVRQRKRRNRLWKLGESIIAEVDEQHLGILRSVYNSTIHRTNERATAARSAFFAFFFR